jgi:phosphoglycolate phosphatase-like HAD superfamily hydrolase
VQRKIDTVLFDIDGTLDDSNDAHANSWVDALAEAGYPTPFALIRPLIGLGSDKLFPKLGHGLSADAEPGKAILGRRREIFLSKYLPAIEPFAGAHDLVAALRAHEYRLIVASSASEEELTPLLRIAHVEDLFDHAMTPNEVENSKPDPDIVEAALAWSKTSRENAVMIGDSRYDVEAAMRARVAAIALRCGGTPDADLAGAAAIFDDPADLLRALERTSFAAILGG